MKKYWLLSVLMVVSLQSRASEVEEPMTDDTRDTQYEDNVPSSVITSAERDLGYDSGIGSTGRTTPVMQQQERTSQDQTTTARGVAGGLQVGSVKNETNWVPPVKPRVSTPERSLNQEKASLTEAQVMQKNSQIIREVGGLEDQLGLLDTTKSNILTSKNAFWQKLVSFLKGNGWQYPDHPTQYLQALDKVKTSIARKVSALSDNLNPTEQDLYQANVLKDILVQEQLELNVLKNALDHDLQAQDGGTRLPNARYYDLEASAKTAGYEQEDFAQILADVQRRIYIMDLMMNMRATQAQKTIIFQQLQADAQLLLGYDVAGGVTPETFLKNPRYLTEQLSDQLMKDALPGNTAPMVLRSYVLQFKARYQNQPVPLLQMLADYKSSDDLSMQDRILAAFKSKLFSALIEYKKLTFEQQRQATNSVFSGR